MTEHSTENDALIEAARLSAEPKELGDSDLYAVPTANGDVKIVDAAKETEYRSDRPARKSGHRSVSDPESLVEYLRRHHTTYTEVWADLGARKVIAYVDGHGEDHPGYHEHIVTLDVEVTPEWKQWLAISGKLLTQGDFAEFIEQRAEDVRPRTNPDGTPTHDDPSAVDLMEIAHTVTGHRNVEFKAGHRLDNGDVQVTWVENTKAASGKTGEKTIPSHLALAIRPFVGGTRFLVEASLRYRVDANDGVTLGWTLINPLGVLEAAFESYVDSIREGLAGLAGDPGEEGEAQGLVGVQIPLYLGKVTKAL